MKFFKKYINKYIWLYLISVTFVGVEAICDLMGPTIMSKIIDDGVRKGDLNTVFYLGSIMLSIVFVGSMFSTMRNIIASHTAQQFGADLRMDVFSKIMRFSETSADNLESGSLITRMTNDTTQMVNFASGMMRIFFKAPIVCIGSITLAFMLSPKMSIVMFGVVIVVGGLISVSMSMSYKRFTKVQYALDKINNVVQEYLLGIRLVKAFGKFDDEIGKFEKANHDLTEKTIKSQMVINIFSPIMSLCIGLGISIVIYWGSIMFGNGDMEVGKISAFILYMMQILHSLLMITNIFNTFVRTKASAIRIIQVLESEEDNANFLPKEKQNSGEIIFENVSFSYPNSSGTKVLDNISFSINNGETLAIIGPTGAGKSTIIWLLLRFYNLMSGKIYFNNADISSLDISMLRENISIAPQKSMLFTGTIEQNIMWGSINATKTQVKFASQIAQSDEFIQKTQEGYQTVLGQRGVNLSGGQKQRISIARAIIKDSPLLILDDCTSALDAVTEAKVRTGLKNLPNKKTIILITQRIGTAMTADKILVLDNGKNVGFGNHQTLLKECKTYSDIFDSQIGNDMEDIYGEY